jgi:putative hemolysin
LLKNDEPHPKINSIGPFTLNIILTFAQNLYVLEPVKIDIEKVIAAKNPGLARMLPGFILRWLKRTLHQDDINRGLDISKDIKDLEFATFSIDFLEAKVDSSGRENIPQNGGVIIASNHPLGGLDGLALMQEAGKARKDIRFVVNDILTQLPNFETIVVGVNKHGANARKSLEAIEQAYANGFAVLIFPAGLCSRKMDDGAIRDLEWQKSFIARAQKYNLPVVPTFIKGKNSPWFYNLARWRKKLGIKANIEMLYLPDEMFKQRGQNIHITFGKPIPAAFFDKSKKTEVWAAILRDYIYAFSNDPNLRFEDFANKV